MHHIPGRWQRGCARTKQANRNQTTKVTHPLFSHRSKSQNSISLPPLLLVISFFISQNKGSKAKKKNSLNEKTLFCCNDAKIHKLVIIFCLYFVNFFSKGKRFASGQLLGRSTKRAEEGERKLKKTVASVRVYISR